MAGHSIVQLPKVIAIDVLRTNISTSALLDSAERFDAPRCQEGTRQAIIQSLIEWAESEGATKPILWLFGAAGAGKSSIAHTFVERLRQTLGVAAASFFFSRVGRGEIQSDRLISTLAYQLALTIPGFKRHICNSIETDPTIFSRNLESQLVALIIRPLEELSSSPEISVNKQPAVLIIDGLDECEGRDKQTYILSILSTHLSKVHYPLLCLVASRPECEIKNAFYHCSLSEITHLFALDVDYRADDDIKLYLVLKFQEIKSTHRLARYIPADWPNKSSVHRILRKSSGQFVYAATVIKFIQDCRGNPVDRLNVVLNTKAAGQHTPFAELDALYTCILDSANPSHVPHIHNVLAYIFFLKNPFMVAFFTKSRSRFPWRHTAPNSLEGFWGYNQGYLYELLADVQALIRLPEPDEEGDVRILHASLEDYLLDKSRSTKYHLDRTEAFAKLAERCLENILKYTSKDTMPSDVLLKAPEVALSFLKFPELCCEAYPQSLVTLSKLEILDFANYFECLDRIDLHGIPENVIKLGYNFGDFMVWLEDHFMIKCPSQVHDGCMCARFISGFDLFLRATVLSRFHDSVKDGASLAKVDLILTAIALPSYFFRNHYFPNFVNNLLYPEIKLPLSPRASHGFNNRFLRDFLTNVSRSKEYYRHISHYVDLASQMILLLNSELENMRDIANYDGDNDHGMEEAHYITYVMDAILAILSLFPQNERLIDILRTNTKLRLVEGGKWKAKIEDYISTGV